MKRAPPPRGEGEPHEGGQRREPGLDRDPAAAARWPARPPNRYLALFVQESREQLEAFGGELGRIERAEGGDLDELFRLAHSLKGGASAMGFGAMVALAHELEALLLRLRSRPMGELPDGATDLLARVASTLEEMVSIHAGGGEPTEAAELVRALHEIEIGGEPRAPQGPPSLEHDRPAGAAPERSPRPPGGARSEPPLAPADEPPRGRGAREGSEPPLIPTTTRIRTDALDDLLDEVGELVLALARLREEVASISSTSADPPREGGELTPFSPDRVRPLAAPARGGGSALPSLDRKIGALQRQAKRLHAQVLTARLTPLAALRDRLQAVVRSAARASERRVSFELRGAELELDRSVLDGLVDPLGHLLRNGIHHGIERPEERAAAGKPAAGALRLHATRSRDRLRLVVEDDGRGIDADALRRRALELGLLPAAALEAMPRERALWLCCLPGLSTEAEASTLAGRGMGMDQVARSVERLGGQLSIESEAGQGTRFVLDLPLGISVVQVLLVGVGDQIYALSLARIAAAAVDPGDRAGLPLVALADLLAPGGGPLPPAGGHADPIETPPEPRGARPFVVVEVDEGRIALEVDRLVGYEEAVVRPLSPPLDRVVGTSGVLLLGTGRPVFLLDVNRLLDPEGVALGPTLR